MDNLTLFKSEENSVENTNLAQKAFKTHVNLAGILTKASTTLPKVYEAIEADSKFKRDKLVKEDLVRLSVDLKCQKYVFTKNGLLTLNDFTDIPNAMFEYLYEKKYHADYADYCNHELDKRAEKKRVSKEFLLRFRKIKDVDHIRGVMSNRYGIIDHIDVMKAIVKGLPGGKFDCKCTNYWYDGDSLGINILMPDYIKDDEGSEYSCGVTIGNSEIKAKTFSIHPYIYSKADGTGYLWGKRDLAISVNQKHVGKIETAKIDDLTSVAIKASLSIGKSLIVFFSYAKKIKISNGLRIIASICRDYKLSIPQGKKIHEAYLSGKHANTAFGIINAISVSALNYSGPERECLEKIATQLLAPTIDSTKIQVEKRWESIGSRAYLLDAKIVSLYEHKGV